MTGRLSQNITKQYNMSLAINITENGLAYKGKGKLRGINVNSHTTGTIKIVDGLEAGGVAVGTITQSVGAATPAYHAQNTLTSSGASVAGTHAVTVFTATDNFQEGVKASAVLTSDQTQPTAAQTVVVGGTTYTFTALGGTAVNTSTAVNVPLGNNTAETMNNLYNAMRSHELIDGIDVVKTSTYVITITAKNVGTAGNSIAATETSTHLDFDGSNTTLTGGVAADTITIGTTVYTAKTKPAATYEFAVGDTLAASLINLKNIINGTYTNGTPTHTQVVAAAYDETTITLRGRVPGTSLNTVATTETCYAASFADSTLGGGTGASDAGITTGAATITIGATVYTVVDELSENYGAAAVAYQVKKGASEATMLDNLKAAMNASGTAGTEYSTGTLAHPDFVATTNTDTVQTIRARRVGGDTETTRLNGLATTETMANLAWADSTCGGGTGNANPAITTSAATITINGRVYTGVLELTESLTGVAVADQILWVTSEAVFLDNIKAAINGGGVMGTDYSTGTTINYDVMATTNGATTQVIQARYSGSAGNSITTTSTMTNYAWGATTLASGTGATGRTIINTYTIPAVGFINIPDADFNTGIYVSFAATVVNATVYIDLN